MSDKIDAASLVAERHAVVTGGARGIGAAIAAKLHTMGANITIMGRNEQALLEASNSLLLAVHEEEPGKRFDQMREALERRGDWR